MLKLFVIKSKRIILTDICFSWIDLWASSATSMAGLVLNEAGVVERSRICAPEETQVRSPGRRKCCGS